MAGVVPVITMDTARAVVIFRMNYWVPGAVPGNVTERAAAVILFLLVLLCFIVFLFVCVCVCVCAYGPPWPSTLRSGARIDDVHAAMTIKQGAWRYKRPATVVPVPWWSPVGVIHIL